MVGDGWCGGVASFYSNKKKVQKNNMIFFFYGIGCRSDDFIFLFKSIVKTKYQLLIAELPGHNFNLKQTNYGLEHFTNNIFLFKDINIYKILRSLIIYLKIKPFLVPHREDYSETVGFKIATSKKELIYIPDIDNWEKWDISITELIKNIDFALVDGTFFSEREIERDISLIPHPLVKDSLKLFSNLKAKERNKIIFTHFNHTNPLIDESSKEHEEVLSKGFRIAKEGDNFY